jgi:hypothetical protein
MTRMDTNARDIDWSLDWKILSSGCVIYGHRSIPECFFLAPLPLCERCYFPPCGRERVFGFLAKAGRRKEMCAKLCLSAPG